MIEIKYLENAIHALLGLSGECDGYIACAVKHHDGTFGFASDEMFMTVDDLIDWYKNEFPEEID